MKKYITVLMLIISMGAQALDTTAANSAGFNDLTEVQKAEILQQIAQKAAANVVAAETPKVPIVDEVQKWVNVSASIGKGFAEAARELGITANDFAKTPVGVMTSAIIIWNFIGSAILKIIGAFAIWIIGLYWLRLMFNRATVKEIEYHPTEKTFFGRQKIVRVTNKGVSDYYGWWPVAGLSVLLLGVAVLTF